MSNNNKWTHARFERKLLELHESGVHVVYNCVNDIEEMKGGDWVEIVNWITGYE
jgi:hypothetical protein